MISERGGGEKLIFLEYIYPCFKEVPTLENKGGGGHTREGPQPDTLESHLGAKYVIGNFFQISDLLWIHLLDASGQ